MSKLEAVCFDLGDTLVDLGEGRGSYEQRLIERVGHVYDVLAATGVALPERQHFCRMLAADSEAQYHAALAEQRGIDIYTIMRRFIERAGIPVSDGLVQAGGDAYCTGGAGVPSPLRTGAREVLAELRGRGLRLGAISNTVQPGAHHEPEHDPPRPGRVLRRAALFIRDRRRQAASRDLPGRAGRPRRGGGACSVRGRSAGGGCGRRQGVGMKGVLIEVAHRAEHDPAIIPDARIVELPELLEVLVGLFE